MLERIAIVVAVAGLIVVTPGAQRPLPPIAGDELQAALASDTDVAKRQAIARATQSPRGGLSTEAVQALAHELKTLVAMQEKAIAKPDPLQVASDIQEGSDEEPELIQILARQNDPAAIDALADVVDTGSMARDTLIAFGEQAVPSLVRVARLEGVYHDRFLHMAVAMDALEAMLESADIRKTLSPASLQGMRDVARERIANSGNRARLLEAAVYLGVATGDAALRREAEFLIDNNAEFVRRGIDAVMQQRVTNDLRDALAKTYPVTR